MADTVYILGAGVNRCVRYWGGVTLPLAMDFFQIALSIDHFNADRYHDKMRPLYDYIERYWKVTVDDLRTAPFDIEDLFTLLAQQTGEAERLKDQDRYVALARIEFQMKLYLAELLAEFEHHAVTSETIRGLGELLYREKPAIITFNYDLIIESAIEHASNVRPDIPESFVQPRGHQDAVPDDQLAYSHFNWNRPLSYGIRFDEVRLQRAGIDAFVEGQRFYGAEGNELYEWPLLKLHGSLNWFQYLPIPSGGRAMGVADLLEKRGQLLLGQGNWWFARQPDHRGWLLDPLLITPAMNKEQHLTQPVFQKLWGRARDELRACKRLIVIGYSFPPGDFNTRRLLLEAFADHALDELTVVNPDAAAIDRARELVHFNKAVRVCQDLAQFLR